MAAREVGRPRPPLLPCRGVARRALVRRAHRRCQRDQRVLRERIRRADGAHQLRRTHHRSSGARASFGAAAGTAQVPPRRCSVRTREPRRRHRRGYCASSARYPLVVVGAAPYADEYTARVKDLADARVRFLGGVWDQSLLNELYANALTYQHGHSVGGTNPSLLRAIGAGAATDAFSVSFNRDVLGDGGRYWSTATEVAELVEHAEQDLAATLRRGERCRARAATYRWDDVAADYEKLCRRLAAGEQRRAGRSGRRNKLSIRADRA